jgi:hypothetical protein
MDQNRDNVIPFRRPGRPLFKAGEPSQPSGHRTRLRAVDAEGSCGKERQSVQPTIRKPAVPAHDIELSRRLAATTFLTPEQFLHSIGSQGEALRREALRREANLLARVMASNHRVFVLAPNAPADAEAFYRRCHRLKSALDAIAAEFGRASLYNLGSIAVTFDPNEPSAWHRAERNEEQLRLNDAFSEEEVIDLLRPRLKRADVYEHEIFDVGHRNG